MRSPTPSPPEDVPEGVPDEFDVIARLMRPLAAPEALDLLDDAAVIPSRPGFDLVVTKDAIVEGVHFLPGTPLDLVARKLLRVNLSDIAAKGAVPYGYLLACAWPDSIGWSGREAFAKGLAEDQAVFGLKLFGGDTVATRGPVVFSATLLGWVESGQMVKRSGAQAGDLVQVSGPIGDGYLGLQAARGSMDHLDAPLRAALLAHYQTPQPRLDIALAGAHAAADVSDGLLADAGHIASASGVAMEIALEAVPLSTAGQAWVSEGDDRQARLGALAAGGDDYQIVATGPEPLPGFTVIGRVIAGEGVCVTLGGAPVLLSQTGYRHGNLG